jgi:hypothetical protein
MLRMKRKVCGTPWMKIGVYRSVLMATRLYCILNSISIFTVSFMGFHSFCPVVLERPGKRVQVRGRFIWSLWLWLVTLLWVFTKQNWMWSCEDVGQTKVFDEDHNHLVKVKLEYIHRMAVHVQLRSIVFVRFRNWINRRPRQLRVGTNLQRVLCCGGCPVRALALGAGAVGRQFSSWGKRAGFAYFRTFGHIELLLGVNVRFQNYSLMQNDTRTHQIMPWLDVTHSESLLGNIWRRG